MTHTTKTTVSGVQRARPRVKAVMSGVRGSAEAVRSADFPVSSEGASVPSNRATSTAAMKATGRMNSDFSKKASATTKITVDRMTTSRRDDSGTRPVHRSTASATIQAIAACIGSEFRPAAHQMYAGTVSGVNR